MHAVHNARIALLANLLNTMAGASFAIGVAAPTATAFFYGGNPRVVHSVAAVAIVWLGVCGGLHACAQAVLGRLRQ